MTSVRLTGAAGGQAGGDTLFDAPSYADWVRGAMRIKQARPDVSILFESTIAEPTEALIDVVREAFSEEVTSRYVSVFADGNRYAIEAVAKRYGLAADQILATTGATGALALVLKALVSEGDHALVERPGFDLLARLASDAGARVGDVTRSGPRHAVDLEDLRRRLTPETRAVLITNLHNPTGAWLSPDEVTQIAGVAATVGAILVVDEVYADFAAVAGAPPAATLGPNIVPFACLT